MTAAPEPNTDATGGVALNNRFLVQPEKKWLIAWNQLSERANPIVVKEARQALNSRHFTLAFGLTLFAIIGWTIMAVVMQLPQLYYLPGGMLLLSGYMVILAFPLLLVIPFSAFRSMITEAEERTFELVSISALSAQQIVNGKMASSVLQTIVYISALTPCFVITYLLRGVLLSSIIYYLVFTLLLSVTMTGLGILLAAFGRAKLLQVFATIIMLAGSLFVFIYWSAFSVSTLDWWDFGEYGLTAVAAAGSVTAAILLVVMRSATAAIDFPSENHATALRLRLAALTTVVLAWGLYLAVESNEYEVCYAFVIAGLFVFLVVAAFVVAERGVISPRAQRTLPKTVLGRVFATWLFPGASMGYIFLTCLFSSYLAAWIVLAVVSSSISLRIPDPPELVVLSIVCWCYFVFYSGLGRLLMLAIPRVTTGRMIVGLVLQIILVLAGSTLPYLGILLVNGFRFTAYGWHQFTNIPWTLIELESGGSVNTLGALSLLALCALAVFGLNLLLSGKDVLLVRAKVPGRVQTEIDAHNPPEIVPTPDPFA